jgi:O-antigen biosynthesis protein
VGGGGEARLTAVRVSVVTVTYQAAGFLPSFCQAVSTLQEPAPEIVVVDNASTDASAAMIARDLPQATLIRSPRNLGFAGGSNLGAARATGDVLVFLNPDTRPPPDAIAALATPVWERQEVGAIGCKLVFPDGRIQGAGGLLGPNAVPHQRGWGEVDRGQYDSETEVDYVPGAALAITRARFAELGGFYEGYFPGFFEDTELSVRLRARGYRVLYRPVPRIEHLGSATMGRRAHYWMARNRMLFLARNRAGARSRGLAQEAAWLYRANLRPLAASLIRHRSGALAAWQQLAAVLAGEVAGLVASRTHAGRRRDPIA